MFAQFQFHESLVKALEQLGWTDTTPVQALSIPHAMNNKDLQVCAQTGSGKTAAFFLPLLNHLISNDSPNTATRAMILVPTRELAQQVVENGQVLAKYSRIQIMSVTGGEPVKPQAARIRKNPEIIVATPGRLVEHLANKSVELNDLEYLILDEADRMLDMGFSEDIEKICSACNEQRVTWLYSATLHARGLGKIIRELLTNPVLINTVDEETPQKITQQRLLADDIKHKDRLLHWLLTNDSYSKALVFANTRDQAEKIGGLLRYHKYRVEVLHGEKQQDRRKRIMAAFRASNLDVLVATDVAARGLDIEGVDLIINYDVPRSGDEYLHRIGRTGRAGNEGVAVSFITERDWNLMAGIERYLDIKTDFRKVPGLEGKYKGPKKVKASGKAASSKKKPAKGKKSTKPERDKKRKQPITGGPSKDGGGMIRKKKTTAPDQEE